MEILCPAALRGDSWNQPLGDASFAQAESAPFTTSETNISRPGCVRDGVGAVNNRNRVGLHSSVISRSRPAKYHARLPLSARRALFQKVRADLDGRRIQRAGETLDEAIAMACTLRGGGPKRGELVEQVHDTDVRAQQSNTSSTQISGSLPAGPSLAFTLLGKTPCAAGPTGRLLRPKTPRTLSSVGISCASRGLGGFGSAVLFRFQLLEQLESRRDQEPLDGLMNAAVLKVCQMVKQP